MSPKRRRVGLYFQLLPDNENVHAEDVVQFLRLLDRYLRKHHGPPYARSVRRATKTALVLRYVAARAAWRRSQAAFYRASMRALRAVHHA